MKYLCLVYVEEKNLDALSSDESRTLIRESLAYDEELRRSGHLIAAQALQHVQTATTVRVRNGRLSTTDGPFAETKEQLGGFIFIDARDLNEALQVASKSPMARVGPSRCGRFRNCIPSGQTAQLVSEDTARRAHEAVDGVYRSGSRRVLATLIRLLGDFDLAEEALHDAFAAAMEQWPRDGVPANPRAWLVSTGRFKAIDATRRRARFDASLGELAERMEAAMADAAEWDDPSVEDDRLRLIFTCCHPALAPDAQVALTLREVCGLTTEEIARAFLTAPSTVAQRIVRAKAKIRDAGIPYQVPSRAELTWRTPRERTCAVASDERRRPVRLTSAPSVSRGSNRSAGSSSDGWPSWRADPRQKWS